MPFCTHCGNQQTETDKFCTKCGRQLSTEPGTSVTPTEVSPHLIHFLCYLFVVIGGVVFLLLEPYKWQKQTRFHAWQSILFGATWLGMKLSLWVLSLLVGAFWMLSFPVQIGFFVLWIILMVQAAQGKQFRIPILADLAEQQSNKI